MYGTVKLKVQSLCFKMKCLNYWWYIWAWDSLFVNLVMPFPVLIVFVNTLGSEHKWLPFCRKQFLDEKNSCILNEISLQVCSWASNDAQNRATKLTHCESGPVSWALWNRHGCKNDWHENIFFQENAFYVILSDWQPLQWMPSSWDAFDMCDICTSIYAQGLTFAVILQRSVQQRLTDVRLKKFFLGKLSHNTCEFSKLQ